LVQTQIIMRKFTNRIEMLSLVPANSAIAELGVYAGEFSEALFRTNPKELSLIDRWSNEDIECGDANGENIQVRNGIELYLSVSKKFAMFSNVIVLKQNTSFLANYKNDWFDLIYIDADHHFEGVLMDLIMSFDKVKNGGFIMCHDYNSPEAGVKDAVDKFCSDYGQAVEYIALDKSNTAGIKIKK